MNENRKKCWLYAVLTLGASAGAAYFQHILNRDYADLEKGLYEIDATAPGAFYVFLVVAVLLMLTPVFTLRQDSLPKELKHGGLLTRFTAVASAVVLIISSVSYLMSYKANSPMVGEVDTAEKLTLLCSVLAFPAAIYFFSVAFSGKTKSKFSPFLSFFPVLWTLSYLMSVYFDRSMIINSPIKTLEQLSIIAFMVYQLFESRAMLGKSKGALYFCLSNITVILLSAAFVSKLIPVVLGAETLAVSYVYIIYFCVSALYIFARITDFASVSDGGSMHPKKIFPNIIPQNEELFTEEEDEEYSEEVSFDNEGQDTENK